MSRHVPMFSGGLGSWLAAKRVAERHGTDEIRPHDSEREEFGDVPPYPVCVHHSRAGRMVPLSDIFSWKARQ